jgi:uncharacterized iron-regulated membrane protein
VKRTLFILHRWLGIALGLFMLIWFFSGLVMVYAGSSRVGSSTRLAHSPPLPTHAVTLSAAQAWQRAYPDQAAPTLGEARLLMQAGEPVWLLIDQAGQRHVLSAQDGQLLRTDASRAVRLARDWAQAAGDAASTPMFLDTVRADAGTRMMSFDPFRPLHRVALNDADGTQLHISAKTGEVVRATTTLGRTLTWLGSWLHFLRPLDDIGLSESRKDILTWSALVACFATLTGLWVGWQRWRPGWFGQRRYATGLVHPYRSATWPRWHFWLGLTGGVWAMLWIFSGFLANNPWHLFSHAGVKPAELARYQQGSLPAAALDWRAPLATEPASPWVALHWRHLGEHAVLLAYQADGRVSRLSELAGPSNSGPRPHTFSQAELERAARALYPDSQVVARQWLSEGDSYYYLRPRGEDPLDKPFPVLRLQLDDPAATWLYLDASTGQLVKRIDRSRRSYRWLFNALHSWDLPILRSRPLWDGWMIVASLLGIGLGVTSLVLGGKRLARTLTPARLTRAHTKR